MKVYKQLFFTSLFLLIFSKVSFGADITVICNLSDCGADATEICTMYPADYTPLFEESGMMPGDTARRVLRVENQGSCDCGGVDIEIYNEQLSPTTPASFPSELFTVIKNGVSDVYGARDGSKKASGNKDLQDAYDEIISLGALNAGQTKSFDWLVTFNPNAGNEYQNARTQFDFDMMFTCGAEPENSDGGDDGDNNDGNDDGGGDSTPTTQPIPVLQTVAGFFTSLIEGPIEAVEGTQTTATPSILPVEEVTEVAGAKTECIDPWFWWIFFLIEIFGFAIVYKLISEKYLEKRKRFYFAWFGDTALFGVVYYIFFCPWWDWILALLFGAVALVLIKRKFQKLQKKSSTLPLDSSPMYKKIE